MKYIVFIYHYQFYKYQLQLYNKELPNKWFVSI